MERENHIIVHNISLLKDYILNIKFKSIGKKVAVNALFCFLKFICVETNEKIVYFQSQIFLKCPYALQYKDCHSL